MNIPISAVLICKNAEKTLTKTLQSLTEFSEVVLYDNGSTDRSLEIANAFDNVVIHQGPFLGFGPTKQQAVSLAKHDWVFSLDCDESLSETLTHTLTSVDLGDPSIGYTVLRENHCFGKPMQYGGWQNDVLLRLFHRDHYRFNDAKVHENVEAMDKANIKTLEGILIHEAVTEVSQFLEKINFYSELRSQTLTQTLPLPMIVLKSWVAFVKSYVIKKGFLAGWRGLLIAWSSANGVFYKYIKKVAKEAQPGSRDV